MRERFSFIIFVGLHPADATPHALKILNLIMEALEHDGTDGDRELLE